MLLYLCAAPGADQCARELAAEVYRRTCLVPRIGAALPGFSCGPYRDDVDLTPLAARQEHLLMLAEGNDLQGWLIGLDHVRMARD